MSERPDIEARFISIEGGEGAGKSTQIELLADWLEKQGIPTVTTREPGGTEGAEAIRQLLMSGAQDRWNSRSEALLFAAARADHVVKLIKPSLEGGKWVISDRFIDSSRAYQSGGSGLSDSDILELHRIGSDRFMPDMTIVLDLPLEEATARANARDGMQSDRFGARNREFHDNVAAAFHAYADAEPNRFRVIDASGSPETVHNRIVEQVRKMTS